MLRLANALPSFRGGSNGSECHPKAPGVEDSPDSTPSTATSNAAASTTQDTMPIQSIPPWVRELNNSRVTRVTRQSRASSIVSTQSKFTTTTLQEDARSIDINVGGQYFRISRDGSRVTADAPPPYTGPGDVVRFRRNQASDAASLNSQTTLDEEEEDEDEDEDQDGATTPRSSFVTLDTDRGVRANILDPTEFEMPSPVGYEQLNHRASSSTLVQHPRASSSDPSNQLSSSFEEGREEVLHTPRRRVQSRRTASQEVPPTLQYPSPSSPLRRTNGVRLPRLVTSSDMSRATQRPQRFRDVSSPGRPLQVRSAGAVLGDNFATREPRSPDYIGRNARAAFPIPIRAVTTQNTTAFAHSASPGSGGTARDGEQETQAERNTPLAMDDENDISLHYARMMRTLDAGHRKAIRAKDKQVSELREKLNEKDIVLRQQLRAKDFIIDDLKKRLDNLEENVESLLERARHQVEDLWEARWKDRDFHLRERMRRIEEDAQKTIDTMRAAQGQQAAGPLSPP